MRRSTKFLYIIIYNAIKKNSIVITFWKMTSLEIYSWHVLVVVTIGRSRTKINRERKVESIFSGTKSAGLAIRGRLPKMNSPIHMQVALINQRNIARSTRTLLAISLFNPNQLHQLHASCSRPNHGHCSTDQQRPNWPRSRHGGMEGASRTPYRWRVRRRTS